MTATEPQIPASILSNLLEAGTPRAVHQTVLDAVTSRLAADRCAVALEEAGDLDIVATVGEPLGCATDSWLDPVSNLPRRVSQTGESCLVDDCWNTRSSTGSHSPSEASIDRSARSLLCVALGDMGVIVATAPVSDAFSEADLTWLEALSTHATAALERFTAVHRSHENKREPSVSNSDQSLGASQPNDSAVTGFIDNSRDVTEREEHGAEARYEAFTRAFPDYAFIYDTDGQYQDVILGWETDTGRTHSAEDLIGTHIHEVLSEDAADAVLGTVQRAVATGTLQTTEYQIETADGRRRYEGRATPIEEPIEGEESAIFVARDITERYEIQRELRRQNERLDRFASVVSHDLRNPLNVAQGWLDVSRDTTDGEYLDTVSDALDRMETIIEDTLVLARRGRTVSDMEAVFIPELAAKCWSLVPNTDRDVTFVDEFSVRADPDRLRHLFENLFRNAIEHGGTDVTVRVGQLEDAGFYIEDDGPGIPEVRREEVFEPGYTTTEAGTGFGLSIVSELVDAHDWSITVTDGTDGGARFEIKGTEDPSC